MKKLFLVAIFSLFASNVFAAEMSYKFDPFHTNITWSANHFGFSNPSGKFNDVDGVIKFDEKKPAEASVDVTIKIASLSTGLAKFDSHLKSKDFFDVDNFPTAKFVSKKIKILGKNTAKIEGDFTLLGVTKPVTLLATINKSGSHPFTQKPTIGFSATTIIKRSEFGMNYGVPGVSDAIKISIEAEANGENANETK